MANRMPRRRLIVAALIVVIFTLVGGALSCNSLDPSQAPDFTLPTLTGGNITLSELKGTPVVLNFWTTWCGSCVSGLPHFEAVAQQGGGKVRVVAVNVAESTATVQAFFGTYEPTMTVALDEHGTVFVNYCQNYANGGTFVPFTLFIDSEGMVVYRKVGPFASEDALWNALRDVLGITIP